MVYLHNATLLGNKKEGNLTLCYSTDGDGEHYAKLYKPLRERQMSYTFIHVVSNEQNKLTNKQKQTHREQTDSSQWGGGLSGWMVKE